MTAKKKLAQKRLTLLQLAEKLGNVSKACPSGRRACRTHRVFRSQYYEYKRSFQTHGLEGLLDKPACGGQARLRRTSPRCLVLTPTNCPRRPRRRSSRSP